MRELSLFTGAGGGLLGSLILGWEPVQFVERDAYCQRVLAARFPGVPCHSDVADFHPAPDSCDVVSAGFPCQPFSQAGKRLGAADERNGWPHAIRVLRESGAPLFFGENVPGLLSSGYFGTVLGDLAEAGFDAEWCVLGADDVGAPHRRKRLWILAYRQEQSIGTRLRAEEPAGEWRGRFGDGGSPWHIDPADAGHADKSGPQGRRRLRERAGELPAGAAGAEQDIRDFAGDRCSRALQTQSRRGHDYPPRRDNPADSDWSSGWLAEPCVDGLVDGLADWMGGRIPRVAVGVPERVARLRALGNGQVPLTMAVAFTLLARRAGLTW